MQPLGDTVRVIGWDELPPQVREFSESFDPLAKGVLMAHQVEWIADESDFKVAEKGRRTGITFAEAKDDTVVAASRKEAGGDNVYYIGDTKEKGLEFIGYCARMAMTMAQAQGGGFSAIEEYLFEDQQPDGTTKHITAYRIRFASGYQIAALSSRPANVRGLQGIVVIDEAAFHADVEGVLNAATALLIWGGKIRVISTHNGKRNPFYQLCKDIRAELYGKSARVHRYTFDDAVANGLYERVCMMKGWTPSVEGKREWYEGIRQRYGPRKANMHEELDCIARDGGGQAIPGIWIAVAMREKRPVLRLSLDEDFAKKDEEARKWWGTRWIERELAPLLKALDPQPQYVFGMDYARHRDFSVIAPMSFVGPTIMRRVPFLIEMAKVPTRQQEQILWAVIQGLPRFIGGAIDATGMGQTLAEYTADKFGHERINQVVLNRSWYMANMGQFIQAFEDELIDLPRDTDIENDLRMLEEIDGCIKAPDVRQKDLKDPELYRHADSALALALGWFATKSINAEVFAYHPVQTTFNPRFDDDKERRQVRVTGGFRRGLL